jgi:hypothetical protein
MSDWYEILFSEDKVLIRYKLKNRIFPIIGFILFSFFYILLIFNKEQLKFFHHIFFIFIIFVSFYLFSIVDKYIFSLKDSKIYIYNGFLFFIKDKIYLFDDIDKIIISNFFFKYKKKERFEIIVNLKDGKSIKIGNFKNKDDIIKFESYFKKFIDK